MQQKEIKFQNEIWKKKVVMVFIIITNYCTIILWNYCTVVGNNDRNLSVETNARNVYTIN
jgi:hypothetical protein